MTLEEIVGSDIPRGQEVKWYHGGEYATQNTTVSAANVSAGGFALTYLAEFGSVYALVDGVETAILNKKTDKDTPASETTGTDFVTYTGITEGDVVELYYLKISVTTLTQIASCIDVEFSSQASIDSQPIQGQANEVQAVGAVKNTAKLTKLTYNLDFLNAIMGTALDGSPLAASASWTNRFTGMKKTNLVGKRFVSGSVVRKYFLYGAQATGVDQKSLVNSFHRREMNFVVDYLAEVEVTAV